MTVNTRVIKLLLARNDQNYVQIHEGLRLQVIPDIEALPYCQKHQSAAFVASQQYLIVWEDDPKKLLERAQYIQDTLMKMIWGKASAYPEEGEKKDGGVNVYEWEQDLEEGEEKTDQKRPIVLIQPVLTACTIIICFAAIGSGWRNIAIEIVTDKGWLRLAFAACVIPQFWLGLVRFEILCSCLISC